MPMVSNAAINQEIPNQSMLINGQVPENNKRAKLIVGSLVAVILIGIAGTFGFNQYQVQQSKSHLATSVTSYKKAKSNQKLSDAKNVLSQRQSIKE